METAKDSLWGRIRNNFIWYWNQDKRLGIKYTRVEKVTLWLCMALAIPLLALPETTRIPDSRLALLGLALFPIIFGLVVIYAAAMRRLEELVKSRNQKTGGQ